MNITTLPLSYRPNRPFRILFTPFVANCLYKVCGADSLVLPLNTRGLRGNDLEQKDPYNLLCSYKEELAKLGINNGNNLFFHDRETEFTIFLESQIRRGIEDGFYQHVSQKIHYCSCGRVEIPSHVIPVLCKDSRSKIICIGKKGIQCSICGSVLMEKEEYTLVYRLSSHLDIDTKPDKIVPKIQAAMAEISKRPMIVSRLHRKIENDVTFGEFIIDPDHCWIHFLDYLHKVKGLNDFVILIGLNHIPKAVQMVSFIHTINPEIRFKLIVTPLIDLSCCPQNITAKTTTDELLEVLGSQDAVRIFLALRCQWSREMLAVDQNDFTIISKTLAVKSKVSTLEVSKCELGAFTDHFSRQSIIDILKDVRKAIALKGVRAEIIKTLINQNP